MTRSGDSNCLKLFSIARSIVTIILIAHMPRRTPNTPFEASRDDVYEVEAIEAKRRKGGSTEYFVRWKGHLP